MEQHRCADCGHAVDADAKDCPFCWSQRLIWVDVKALRQAEQQSQAIIPASQAPITLPFDPSMLAGQLRPSSIALYRRDRRAYLTYAETAGLDPWQAATFSRWRTRLAEATDLSPHTINRMLSAMKRLLREGAEQGYFSHELASTFQDRKGVQVRARKRALETARPHAHQPGGHAPSL